MLSQIHEGIRDFLYRLWLAALLLGIFVVFGLRIVMTIMRAR